MNGTTVWIDLETGGVEPEHPIIQVAAVAVRGWKEVETYEAKIEFDPSACDPDALKINGYDHRKWAGAEDEADVAKELAEFFARHATMRLVSAKTKAPYTVARVACHNASFDMPRLKGMMDRAKVGWFKACWWYPADSLQLALWTYADRDDAPPNYQLGTLAEHLGVKVDGAAHDALVDARTCVAVTRALLELRRQDAPQPNPVLDSDRRDAPDARERV